MEGIYICRYILEKRSTATIGSNYLYNMFMGLGVTHCRSSKKKFDTKISTGLELADASNYVTYDIWYIMFMHHQGYLNKSNNVFRTNKAP